MEVAFVNPGVEYMIQHIMELQSEDESTFWSKPLYHFYPQLDKAYATSLSFPERRNYIEQILRTIYVELEDTINEKVDLYSLHWANCKGQITAALSDAFCVDCSKLFNDLRCNVSMNPIEPRFLKERCFDMEAGGTLILDTLDEMYRNQSIIDFMKNSYTYCREHEADIRNHIQKSEGE